MSVSSNSRPIPLALTMGEPAGIGPDITIDAWIKRREAGLPPFILLGDAPTLRKRMSALGRQIPLHEVGTVDEACALFDSALPVLPLTSTVSAEAGKPDAPNAAAIIEAIERAVDLTFRGQCSGIVTNPISKAILYSAGFEFPGHTEFLADRAKVRTGRASKPVMMLAGPKLRAIPVTIHIPLKEVPAALTTRAIIETATIADRDLRARYGIEAPKLAISGLNPHAGENGAMGTEDRDVIWPAIEALRQAGVDAFGPLPADTMFHERARAGYDVALCMYHDQALIPAKTLGFDDTVNVTLGLPFIRTSPDHGTAFDIAGTGEARPDSLIAAIRMAANMAARACA